MPKANNPVEYVQLVRQCPDAEFLKAEVLSLYAVLVAQYQALSTVASMLGAERPEPDDVARAKAAAEQAAAKFRYPNRDIPDAVRVPVLAGEGQPANSEAALARAAEFQATAAADTSMFRDAAAKFVATHIPGDQEGKEEHAKNVVDAALTPAPEAPVSPADEKPIDDAEVKKALDAIAAAQN